MERSALSLGSSGPAVASLQQQLSNLGYWLGAVNGQFGDSTQQAVWALQKAAGLSRSGVTDYATYAALAQAVQPQPQSSSGYVIEVNLNTDLVMFVNNGQILYTLNTSTGGGYTYGDGHSRHHADGPLPHLQGFQWPRRRFARGSVEAEVLHGRVCDPRGHKRPPVPVSHGCVRVSDEAINWIWTANLAPIGTTVWVY